MSTAEDGVFLVDMETDIPTVIDIRCDLHARLVRGGTHISFDTTHKGCRDIAVLPSGRAGFLKKEAELNGSASSKNGTQADLLKKSEELQGRVLNR